MKTSHRSFVRLLLIVSLASIAAHAQITPLGDSYTNTAKPTTNYGSATTLAVDGATEATFIQFNLASIPPSASISQATLKLYVNSVTASGSFNVDYVNGSWAESTIDASNAPPLGTNIAANVNVTSSDKNQYILINVTSAVQAWLNGSETNNGIALVANGSFNATFDSKENTGTSHPAELDIAYAGGDGTITGVETAAGSGLTGGGTSGTLNLSLTNACAANQVLQWNGSAWACSNAGTGTITGVTAGTGLSGGGNSGTVTLNNTGLLGLTAGTGIASTGGQTPTVSINTSVVPQLNAANTFTGNQTVSGNLSATGAVTGSGFQIGSNLFDYGSWANQNAFLGFAGNTTMTGQDNTAAGFQALYYNTTGSNNTASGQQALFQNLGSYNTAAGDAALVYNTTGNNNTASGAGALDSNDWGNDNTASGANSGNTTDNTGIIGSNNTFLGYNSAMSTGTLSNATAIGAFAEVSESNALVLGSINGVNSAAASTYVGIGTISPAYLLHVGNTDQSLTNFLRVEGPYKAGTGGRLASFGPYGDFGIDFPNDAEGRFVVKESGNVGIGTAAPDNLLSVNGSADKPGGGSWGTFSDRRLKTLDGEYSSGLAEIMKINPVRYRYKSGNGMGIRDRDEHVGVVAQEVQKAIPEAVTENTKGYLLVNNDPVIWAMLNAIKEQQKEIEELRAKNAAVEAQLAQIANDRRNASGVVSAQLTSTAPTR